jgi:glyoxylase-like metal-dependent hydrolase (beta-lactamase superfamily II)
MTEELHMSVTPAGNAPFPPVERLRPGLTSVPVPLPGSSLGHVFVYVFEAAGGVYLVDAGWNTDEAYDALDAGLASAGYAMADVRGVLVTHVHPDHYGLAGRIREASGAWIALHPADAELLAHRGIEPADLLNRIGTALRTMGAPPGELEAMERAIAMFGPAADVTLPDVLIDDGERPDVPGWDLSAVWTPGHTPGHLCFWEPRHRLLLTGDHVLPRITPNVSLNADSDGDPLGDFLRSLDRLDDCGPDEVLPAHEHRFEGLHARLDQLRRHHDERFREVLVAIRHGNRTAWDIASHMSWSRGWDEIEGFMRRAAVGEALAHLRALERRGVVTEAPGEPSHWSLTDAAGEVAG